jgi:hypothetical protein
MGFYKRRPRKIRGPHQPGISGESRAKQDRKIVKAGVAHPDPACHGIVAAHSASSERPRAAVTPSGMG